MAEVIVGPIVTLCIQPVWKATCDGVGQHLIIPICRFKAEVAELEGKLSEIEGRISEAEDVHLQAIIEFVEYPTRNEAHMKTVTGQWFPNLKAVYYDVDDLLDKWKTVNLISEIDNDPASKKVCCLLSSSYFHRHNLHREIAFAMKGLNGKLVTFEKAANRLKPNSDLIRDAIERLNPITSSLDVTQVYGRDKEKKILMGMLLRGSSQNRGRVNKTIAILGMGGVGKTALARVVFLRDDVKKYFQKKIWVSVSYRFDLTKISRAIIEALEQEAVPDFVGLQILLDKVVRCISGKKLLLVLDGVWSVELGQWNQLIGTLENSDPSSKILVTTQKYKVAQMMGAHSDSMIHLELLSENDCWSIISPLASEADREINGQPGGIRSRFVSKCNGLPLVAHILKNDLLCQSQDWERVLQSEIDLVQTKAIVPFLLNYYELSPLQKHCFSYCSIFPRNYEIENNDAVELWMSQGYFSDAEEEGLNCFKNLADRCLFQDFTKDYNGDIIKFKMHDLVYEFAQFLTKHERVILEIQGADDQTSVQRDKEARHFTLLLKTPEAQIPGSMNKKKNLRTLFVVRLGATPPPNPLSCDLLVKLTSLRTLNLSHCSIEELPEKLDKLVHLRYLNLSGNSLRTLPNALCYLFNLQTLRVTGCRQLEMLPEKMGRLASKFRHLYIEGCDSMTALPKEIARLVHLRTLDMFVVPSPIYPQNHEALVLEDLNRLSNIRGSIHIFRCGNLQNAMI